MTVFLFRQRGIALLAAAVLSAPLLLPALARAADPSLATSHDMHGMGGSHPPAAAAGKMRTLDVTLAEFSLSPETLAIAAGETVRLRLKNTGSLLHQFVIGDAATLAAASEQAKMLTEHGVLSPDRVDEKAAAEMEHSMGHAMSHDRSSVFVPPGSTVELVWTAGKGAAATFICAVPGHADAGMKGTVKP